MPKSPNEVRELARGRGIQIADLKFVDLPGVWQHFSIPVEDLSDDLLGHELGKAGQDEIDMRFTTLTKMADNVMYYKYVVRNVSRKHGKTATFMPKQSSAITAPACLKAEAGPGRAVVS